MTREPIDIIVGIHGIFGGVTRRMWLVDFARHLAWAQIERESQGARLLMREYKAGPFPLWNRLVKNPMVARSYVRDILRELDAWRSKGREPRLHFLTHSNGACIAAMTMDMLAAEGVRTESALMIAAALDSRPERSGLLELHQSGFLGRAIAWWSEADRIIAPLQRRPGPYGSLGARGWEMGDAVRRLGPGDAPADAAWVSREFPGYGHSRYFDEDAMGGSFALALADLGIFAK